MIDVALAHLGKYLQEHLSEKDMPVNLVFEDRENAFKKMSKDGGALDLPAIAFFSSDINPINPRTGLKDIVVNPNNNNTEAITVKMLNVSMQISMVIFASNLKDFMRLSKKYMGLWVVESSYSYDITIGNDHPITMEDTIRNPAPLSVPPAFLERRDHEDSEYYAYDGSVELVSCLFYDSKKKLITHINSSIQLEEYFAK